MVFPYMAHDLAGLLENKKIDRLEPSLLKLYARQLLLGTSYLHRVGEIKSR
jgi:serine/threonine-protein kinase BUR1